MISESLLCQIKRHEGFRAKPYRCPLGFLTVGYGHNLDVPMKPHEADALLEARLRPVVRGVIEVLPHLNEYGEVRANALIDLAFNVGLNGFKRFKKMLAAVRREDWNAAALEMKDSRWYTQVGDRGVELAAMILTGKEQPCP